MTSRGTRVSVAMITYNGARFVQEQLVSIEQQSRPVDELVVVDDGSTDGTLDVLERFASRSRVPCRVAVNDVRLGPRDNAQRALDSTTGDVIFLADQDDVWEPDKVERLCRLLEADGELDLAFTDARLIDARGQLTGRRLWDEVGFGRRSQEAWAAGAALDVLLRQPVVTGATAVLRRRLLAAASPFPDAGLHDEWLALVAVASGRHTAFVREPLLRYRVHDANVAGTPTDDPRRRLRAHAQGWQKRQDVLVQQQEVLARLGTGLRDDVRERLDRSISFRRRRQLLPPSRWRRLRPVVRESVNGNYRRFARGGISAAFDVAAPAERR